MPGGQPDEHVGEGHPLGRDDHRIDPELGHLGNIVTEPGHTAEQVGQRDPVDRLIGPLEPPSHRVGVEQSLDVEVGERKDAECDVS